jgi:hypothetical protein
LALLRVTAQGESTSLDVAVVHGWHVRDGKLTEAWVYPADQQFLDEFWT